MRSEIFSQVLFESSEKIFERFKKLVWTGRADQVSGENVCLFEYTLSYFRRIKTYRSMSKFYALFEYGLRNVVTIFVQR